MVTRDSADGGSLLTEPPAPTPGRATDRPGRVSLPVRVSELPGRVGAGLERLSFWGAVLLPVLYGPAILLGGEGQRELLLLGLVGVHALAVLAGRSYLESGR